MTIDPRGFDDVRTWSDFMTPLIEKRIGIFPRLDDPDQWQLWASTISRGQSLFGQNAPDPYAYADWKEWAMRLFATIDFAG
jgi:hypothetical protein